MLVAMSMVYDILSKRFQCIQGKSYDSNLMVCVAYDRIPEGEGPVRNGIIVVSSANTDEVGERQRSQLVVVSTPRAVNSADAIADSDASLDASPDAPFGASRATFHAPNSPAEIDCSIVVVTPDSVGAVVGALEEGLTEYKSVLRHMSGLALKGQPIHGLVEEAYELLGNPIVVHDAALRVRAHAQNDASWMPLETSGPAYRERIIPKNFQNYIEIIKESRDGCSRFEMHNGVIVYSYRTKEIANAFLVVSLLQKNKPVTEGDKMVLKYLCSLVEMCMKTNARLAKEEIGYNGLMLDALEGRLTDPVEFVNRMTTLGHDMKSYATIMVVSPQKGSFNDRQAQRAMEDIANTFPFGRGVCYQGNLVFYSTHSGTNDVGSAVYERFSSYLARFKMVAAFGNTRPIDYPVSELFRSASFNMRVGRKLFPHKNLLFVEDCQPYWVYELCLLQGNPDLYIHPAINVLREHDSRTPEALSLVLRKLADNRGNRSLAASELCIQRNTLQARIREIEMLCKIDLSDSAVLDHIRRSFELEDYCKGDLRIAHEGDLT